MWNFVKVLVDFFLKKETMNDNDDYIEMKLIDQKFNGIEGWIKKKGTDWIRLDFMLEYFLSRNVEITKKFKGQLRDQNKANQYYYELLTKFKRDTDNGRRFNFQEYKSWLNKNQLEIEKARNLLK